MEGGGRKLRLGRSSPSSRVCRKGWKSQEVPSEGRLTTRAGLDGMSSPCMPILFIHPLLHVSRIPGSSHLLNLNCICNLHDRDDGYCGAAKARVFTG